MCCGPAAAGYVLSEHLLLDCWGRGHCDAAPARIRFCQDQRALQCCLSKLHRGKAPLLLPYVLNCLLGL